MEKKDFEQLWLKVVDKATKEGISLSKINELKKKLTSKLGIVNIDEDTVIKIQNDISSIFSNLKEKENVLNVEKKINEEINQIEDLLKQKFETLDWKDIKNKPNILTQEEIKGLKFSQIEHTDEDHKGIMNILREIYTNNGSIKLSIESREKLVKSLIERLDSLFIPINHDDLKEIYPDQHHKEKHTLESHLDSVLMEQLKRLVSGEYVDDLHKHFIPREEFPQIIDIAGITKNDADLLYLGITSSVPLTLPTIVGQANKFVKVKADESGFEFGSGGSSVGAFTDLTDVPSAYSGAGKLLRINSTNNGLEFFTSAYLVAADLVPYSTKAQADLLYKPIGYTPDLSAYSTTAQANLLYLGISATAADSAKLNGQSASYYLHSETDPVFSTWLSTTPPLYSEVDPLSIHLDQTSPQTFTGGTVTGSGLLKVISGQLGLDTSVYLTSVTAHNILSTTHGDTTASACARGSIIVGDLNSKWVNLAFPATPTGKILQATATDIVWSTNPITIGASASVSGSNTGDQTLASLGAQAQLNGTGFVKASGTTISYDNSTYLTSLSGAVLVSQVISQSIGDTTDRLTKLWAINIESTNAPTVGGSAVYYAGGTDVALADGGTGASLTDPGANVLLGWDDTDNAIKFITIGTGLSYDHATYTLSSTGGTGLTQPQVLARISLRM